MLKRNESVLPTYIDSSRTYIERSVLSKEIIERRDSRIGAVALGVDGGQIFALLHVDLERSLLVVVLKAELHFSSHSHGAVSAFSGARVHTRQRVTPRL